MPLYRFMQDEKAQHFYFFHVPKTGGSAIEAFMRNAGFGCHFDPQGYREIRSALRIPPAHFDYAQSARLFRLDRMFSFAIIRHPVARMISEFKWATTVSAMPAQVKSLNFSDFIRYVFDRYSEDEEFLAGHIKPQYRFTGEHLSRVFRYETGLNTILRDVFNEVGYRAIEEPALPVINKSADLSVSPTYGDMQLIRRFYHEDFQRFGYTLDDFDQGARP